MLFRKWSGMVLLLATACLAQAEEKPPEAATVESIARRAKESLVVITTSGREGTTQGIGTGFALAKSGLVATNLHVIGEGRSFTVQNAEGTPLRVKGVRAFDRMLDLAILEVESDTLPALELASSEKVTDGQPVVVMGNPHGLKSSVVSGVVSGRREIDDRKMLQLAVPIEPGNSGGPVLDMSGKVLGVVTMKSAVTNNLGFAVEGDYLQGLLDKPNPVPFERWLTIGALDIREWKPLFGARWQQRGGRILVSGLGQGFGGRSLCLSQTLPPELPYELAVMVKLDDEQGAAGLVFHSDGADKHYGFYPTAGRLRLSRFDGPDVFSWKVLSEKEHPAYRPGDWNHLRVRVEKERLRCYINHELVIESDDQELTSGRIGLAKFRQTEAQFKRFWVGQQFADNVEDEAQRKVLQSQITDLPPLQAVREEMLTPLSNGAASSVQLLRAQAELARARAKELEQLASEVHARGVVAELAKIAGPGVEQVDLLRAGLLIGRLDEEEIDVEAYLRQADRLADEIKSKFPKGADEQARLKALRDFLFEENGFHGSRLDYYNRANSYLNRVLDDREGLPITLSVLFMELGRRLDLKIEGVGLPGHFIVRFVPTKGESELLDVFEGAKPLSRADADAMVRRLADRPLREDDLKAAEPRQILLRMLQNLLGVAQSRADREALLRYLEAILALDPTLARERGMRAMVRFETGRRAAALADLDWFFEHKPEGIDLDQIRSLAEYMRTKSPPR
jgi:regulator of sirC expression with transglutaminase-like and TPR domain